MCSSWEERECCTSAVTKVFQAVSPESTSAGGGAGQPAPAGALGHAWLASIAAQWGTRPKVYIESLSWLETDLSQVSSSVQLYVPELVSIWAHVVLVSHRRTPPRGTVGKWEA